MRNANIKIRVDSKTKQQAQKFARNLGLDLNIIVNNFLQKLIKNNKNYLASQEWQGILQQIKAVN